MKTTAQPNTSATTPTPITLKPEHIAALRMIEELTLMPAQVILQNELDSLRSYVEPRHGWLEDMMEYWLCGRPELPPEYPPRLRKKAQARLDEINAEPIEVKEARKARFAAIVAAASSPAVTRIEVAA